MNTCDMHTHSLCSDGTATPAQIVQQAARIGLSAVALTDHNTIEGLPAFLQAADKTVRAVPGVEVTADYEGDEIHIVGLFIDPSAYAPLTDFLSVIRVRKRKANEDACERLLRAGFAISPERILNAEGSVNRVHFAKELMRCGYAASIDEAFAELLAPERGLYVPSRRLDGFEVIDCLRQLGIVPVLAHPFLDLTVAQLQELLPKAKRAGLIGLEARYSRFSPSETQLAEALAEAFGLLPGGGSDYHGANKPGLQLGTGYGDLEVPLSYLEALEQAI
ncbi:MAG: PHP domain-containing protein [Oscillospiraceae bacterium]|nr:PHP domain-containing protein [Oscillospiraceae bacterium]